MTSATMRLFHGRSPEERYKLAVLLPISQIEHAPAWVKKLAFITVAVEWLLGSPLAIALIGYIAFGAMDYLLGSKVAAIRHEWDEHTARAGLLGKVSGVALILAVWLLELLVYAVALRYGLELPPGTVGALATALALMLSVNELDSYDRKREELTGKPTPLLRPILNALRAVIERLVPVPKSDSDR